MGNSASAKVSATTETPVTASTTNSSVEDQLKAILTTDLLLRLDKVHNPWPKGTKLDIEEVSKHHWTTSETFPRETYQITYEAALKPISQIPLSSLLSVNLDHIIPSSDDPTYIEQCVSLSFIFDSARMVLVGTDQRYINSFFDPLAEKIATYFLRRRRPLHDPSLWLEKGFSFEEWATRVLAPWTPLLHSENFMTLYRDDVKSVMTLLRKAVEKHTDTQDPYADQEADDEKNLFLFPELAVSVPPTKESLGRDVQLEDYIYFMLRMFNAHFALTDRFGRYPYRNDVVGRDFTEAELEWMNTQTTFERLKDEDRIAIRKDVDQGVWSPLKGNPALE